jgi:hypothetical protein
MGSINTRAGTVPPGTDPVVFRFSGITGAPTSTLPNLLPQQSFHHQVQISGQIWLAYPRGRRVRAQHKQATARK